MAAQPGAAWTESSAARNFQQGSNNNQYNADTINILERKVPYETIFRWLSPLNPIEHHAAARRQHHEHTGLWLLESDSYQKWKSGDSKHLWIYGKPGCGKTVLCSTIIEDLRNQLGKHGLAMFYFSFSNTQQHDYHHFLRSVLAQLGHSEPALSALRGAYENGQHIPGPHELQTILHDAAAAAYESVYLVVDGLDEIQANRHEMLKQVKSLLRQTPNVKLLATSREEQSIRVALEDMQADQISIPYSAVTHDIMTYTIYQLSADSTLWSFSEKVKAIIQQKIHDTADGMFRWAALLLGELVDIKSTRPSSIEYALNRFPLDLDGIYARILLNVTDHERADARTMLQWIAYSVEPLTLAELAETVIIDNNEELVRVEDRGSIQDALRLLSSLIVIVRDESAVMDGDRGRIQGSSKIRLAHSTVREYLESRRPQENGLEYFHLESTKDNLSIARGCLAYLSQCSSSSKSWSDQDLKCFPLLDYAGRWWYLHSARHMDHTYSAELRFFSNKHAFKIWIRSQRHGRFPNIALVHSRYFPKPSILYCVCLFGFAPLVDTLLDIHDYQNKPNDDPEYALYAAAYAGHGAIVQTLIQRGVNVNSHGAQGYSALIAAAAQAHEDIVLTLLSAGASYNVTDCDESTPLHEAAGNGLYRSVQLMLARGASASPTGRWGITPLHRAVSRNHIAIIELLLDYGADVNSAYRRQDRVAWPMLDAAGSGFTDTVQLLASRGAIIERQDDEELTPLFWAAIAGHVDTLRLLINLGADATRTTSANVTTLHAAALVGLVEPVKVLVENGASISNVSDGGITSLHAAVESGEIACVKYLIENGAPIRVNTKTGATLLHFATMNPRDESEMIRLLLSYGLQVDQTDCIGRTALHLAAHERALDHIRTLLEAGADPYLPDCYGKSTVEYLETDKALTVIDLGAEYKSPGAYVLPQERIEQTVRTLIRLLIENRTYVRRPGWFELANCFMYLGQDSSAVAAFHANSTKIHEGGEHAAGCDWCGHQIMGGSRFKCRQCANVDFCESCRTSKSNKLLKTSCCNHEFLVVSPDSVWSADRVVALEQQMSWLHSLRDEYAEGKSRIDASCDMAMENRSNFRF